MPNVLFYLAYQINVHLQYFLADYGRLLKTSFKVRLLETFLLFYEALDENPGCISVHVESGLG